MFGVRVTLTSDIVGDLGAITRPGWPTGAGAGASSGTRG